MKNGFWT